MEPKQCVVPGLFSRGGTRLHLRRRSFPRQHRMRTLDQRHPSSRQSTTASRSESTGGTVNWTDAGLGRMDPVRAVPLLAPQCALLGEVRAGPDPGRIELPWFAWVQVSTALRLSAGIGRRLPSKSPCQSWWSGPAKSPFAKSTVPNAGLASLNRAQSANPGSGHRQTATSQTLISSRTSGTLVRLTPSLTAQ